MNYSDNLTTHLKKNPRKTWQLLNKAIKKGASSSKMEYISVNGTHISDKKPWPMNLINFLPKQSSR
jgi:hypothetical protein